MRTVTARPTDLVDLRASLLDAGPSDELDDVTDRLRAVLTDGEPFVRQVTDVGRAADLLRREPVHPVDPASSGSAFASALADRTDVDRRLFELVHPALEGRPLNVVWVALCRGIPSTMAELLDDRPALDPGDADTAVFWSIWNGEAGLAGLGRGSDLIYGATDLLRRELPGIDTFITLSPVPGLRRWLDGHPPDGPASLSGDELVAAATSYLTSLGDDGRPLDPVARFHLGNGARLWRVLPDADPSARGQDRSFGVMVNYRYEPEDRAANRAQLANGSVPVGPEVIR